MILPTLPYYHIDRVLSKAGGSSIVYWGIDLRSGYPVAIKQLYASLSCQTEHVENLRNEANRYLYLSHPNLTKLVDFVIQDGKYYLIMEFVDGITLGEYQRTRTGPVAEEVAIPIFLSLLDTIAYLHRNGILHLDIKPENIMVRNDMSIKVLDMGISARFNGNTENPRICGTPAYMPPEQFEKGRLGRYTDIFALGVTLYSMLTAHLPFQGHSRTEIWENIKRGNYTPATRYYPFINRKLIPILDKALRSDGRERYQSCEEMGNDILKLINHGSNNYRKIIKE